MQPRVTRRIYATRRKRSPIRLGVDPNADPSRPFNTGIAGGLNINPQDLWMRGGGRPTPGIGVGSIARRVMGENIFGGFKPGTGVVGPGADLGSGSDHTASVVSRARRRSESVETKTSVPPYLDESSDSRGYSWKGGGGGSMGGTYTITKV